MPMIWMRSACDEYESVLIYLIFGNNSADDNCSAGLNVVDCCLFEAVYDVSIFNLGNDLDQD